MNNNNDPKDQNNLMIAVALSLAVLLGWQYYFAKPQIEQEKARIAFEKQVAAQRAGQEGGAVPGVATPSATAPGGTAPVAAPSSPTTTTPGVGSTPAAQALSRDAALALSPRVAIKTPSLQGSIALKSGRIDDLTLVKYHVTVDPNSDQVTLLSPAGSEYPYFAEYGWVAQTGTKTKVPDRETLWSLETGATLTSDTPVTLKWENGEGLIFRRTISIDDKYMFKIVEEVENTTAADVALLPYARVHRYGHPKSTAFYILHEGLIGSSGDAGLEEITYADAVSEARPKTIENAVGGWLGITDKYWAAALIPDQKDSYRAMYSAVKAATPTDKDAYQVDYLRNVVTIPPNTRKGVEGHLYAGAKQASAIQGYESELGIDKFNMMIDWGMFWFITKPLFWLMEKINGFVNNFGITILILTVIVKAAFFPLANKQYTSMARMKKLQPEMARIKEVHKDDAQRQQKEMFELYRKEKINPLAGCWPILLQIPVFFALYKVLFVTIDMRHAPFFGWIKDLSAPDPTSLFNLFGLLPYAVPEYLHIGVWPILMGITMFVQMQLNPPQPDPIQQQIFTWMPLLFTFLLATFPAGLVIYWSWSNLLSIFQQWYINKKNGAETHLMQNISRLASPILTKLGIKSDDDKKS